MPQPTLRVLQSQYFDILEEIFGSLFSQMREHDLTCAEISDDAASQAHILELFECDPDGFYDPLIQYWDLYGNLVDQHLSKLKTLKAVFGGDLAPSYMDNIATSTGLYMDTIIIPDPILRVRDSRSVLSSKDLLRLTIKHALNVMNYRELALADVDPPIVAIVNNSLLGDSQHINALKTLSQLDLNLHMEKIFDRPFSDQPTLEHFLASFSTMDDLAASVADGSRILFDLDWPDYGVDQLKRSISSLASSLAGDKFQALQGRRPGILLQDHLRGRLMQAHDIAISSERWRGTPLVDAPTSWQYLLWKYEYEVIRSSTEVAMPTDQLVTKALQSATFDDRMSILRASPQVLIELRQRGALEQLRQILRTGITEMSTTSSVNFDHIATEITENINSAMVEHQKKIEDLARSGIKWYGLEVAPMIMRAGIVIAGAATGNIALSTASALLGTLGLPSLKDVARRGKEILAQYREIDHSATGILFRHL